MLYAINTNFRSLNKCFLFDNKTTKINYAKTKLVPILNTWVVFLNY